MRTSRRCAQTLKQVPDADAVLISAPADIRWLTGFTGSNALLVLTRKASYLLTDGRYTEQAAQEVSGPKVHIVSGDLFETAAKKLLRGVNKVAIQEDALTMARATDLLALPELSHVTWLNRRGLVRDGRARKDADELAYIAAAQALTEAVFTDCIKYVQAGVTEHELAARITYGHLRGGASKMAFDPIVASGPNGALPHARPTDRPIQPGELILIDIGCFLNGYASDMTRMVCIGHPGDRALAVHATVTSALEAALSAARAGVTSRALDETARSVVREAGYGPAFSHSLGHGVGLEVHEGPAVSFRSDEELPVDSVITLEPGIYLPGEFGVRIEDIVHLTTEGSTRITRLPHELIMC